MNISMDTSSFNKDLKAFTAKTRQRLRHVYKASHEEAFNSIKGDGTPHPITGAPGQPVDTGFLRSSWTSRADGGSWYARIISTPVAYAPKAEGQGAVAGLERPKDRRKSALGPRPMISHMYSVHLTRSAWKRVVEYALAQVAKGAVK